MNPKKCLNGLNWLDDRFWDHWISLIGEPGGWFSYNNPEGSVDFLLKNHFQTGLTMMVLSILHVSAFPLFRSK